MSDRTLVLLDGMAVVYRAFYAIKELSTSDGRPTNALFGFIRMLKQAKELRKPTHWAVVFDGGIPDERMELLEDYKAQRPETPSDLEQQMPAIEKYLDLGAIPWIREEGWEADDLIASMVNWAKPDCLRIRIVTGDKDLFQLVDPQVTIVPASGSGPEMGEEEVRAKTGVNPDQIVDWLALTGDVSDNVPGVPGVGPKTAAKLLQRFGGISGIYDNLEDAGGRKLVESLRENEGVVKRNLLMLRLHKDRPCPLGWDELAVRPPDPLRLIPFFRDVEFTSFAREMENPTLL